MGFYSDRLKKRGLRHGSGQKMGVLGTGQARKKGGLGTGQVKKGGSLLRHIPVLAIYVSAPPPPPGVFPRHVLMVMDISRGLDILQILSYIM